ncbi:MAG TPA: sigma-54 dependent transcriptional regulator [Syntrophales bacterium]|nr:sigma-54 dependent transcriptional regulator [Syntrophales bacterium]
MATRILVIAHDHTACFIRKALQSSGTVINSCTGPPFFNPAGRLHDDLIIAEVESVRQDGFKPLRVAMPEVPLILILPAGALESAHDTTKWGVWDYIHQPFSTHTVRSVVRHVRQVQEIYRNQIDPSPLSGDTPPRFSGTSSVMMTFYRQIARVADSDASVLVEGESGTGKELTAHALHNLSVRRENPFRIIHCGAIPEALLESELFGYEKGAFTGADCSHPGLIETAQDGTLFLDEITEMAPALQGKLLRFLQNGEVRRLGGHTIRHPAVRVIASTNRDMDQEVAKQRFRADLMFRFVVRLKTPPLREHKEDLPQLVEAFLQRLKMTGICVSSQAMVLLQAYEWPGNIRELENVLHQTHLLSPYPVIRPEHLPERFRHPSITQPSLLTPLQSAERNQIMQTIQNQRWNRSRTARILGIDRKTLRLKMHFYGLENEDG